MNYEYLRCDTKWYLPSGANVKWLSREERKKELAKMSPILAGVMERHERMATNGIA